MGFKNLDQDSDNIAAISFEFSFSGFSTNRSRDQNSIKELAKRGLTTRLKAIEKGDKLFRYSKSTDEKYRDHKKIGRKNLN